ncbi:hypothetical protein FNF28_01990 [Cafeteria roenbergensis]|uniref:cystathionine gamma-lyase n=1 Tax=Cafeteria roenbergensis TaxID=33653 RepID=A0A5A8DVN8_CAFRO|nr:hypothetical protein FNF28_01990 [Cafeteria roenbergensis]
MDTLLAHAGCRVDAESGAVVAPLHLATTFERGPGLDFSKGYIYSRIDNPSRALFELTMARLDRGVAAAAFSSGMAAIHAVLMAFPGGVVVLPDDLYHGVVSLIDGTMAAWGLRTVRYAADGGTRAIEAALDEAVELAGSSPGAGAGPASARVLLWVETPSNPLLRIVDVRAACAAARSRGVASAVDSTWLTPALCRPLDLGADVVVHSATKYIAGHSDVLMGVVVAAAADPSSLEPWLRDAAVCCAGARRSDCPAAAAAAAAAGGAGTGAGAVSGAAGGAGVPGGAASARGDALSMPALAKRGDEAAVAWWARVRGVQRCAGGVAGPLECFLALRGLRTLHLRIERQCANAMALAEMLEAHPAVAAVHYPGLASHPQHRLAAEALFSASAAGGEGPSRFGGMLSVRLRGGEEAARAVAARLTVTQTATSLGGTESLVEHRASIEPAGTATPWDLLRVSVGIESAADLIADWRQALDAVRGPQRSE